MHCARDDTCRDRDDDDESEAGLERDSRKEDDLHDQRHHGVNDDDDDDQRPGELGIRDLSVVGPVMIISALGISFWRYERMGTHRGQDGVDVSHPIATGEHTRSWFSPVRSVLVS